MKIFILSIISFLWVGCGNVSSDQDVSTNPKSSSTPFQAEIKPKTATTPQSDSEEVKPLVVRTVDKEVSDSVGETVESLQELGEDGSHLVKTTPSHIKDVDVEPEASFQEPNPKVSEQVGIDSSPEQTEDESLPEQSFVGVDSPRFDESHLTPQVDDVEDKDSTTLVATTPSTEETREINIPPINIDDNTGDKIDSAVEDSVNALVNKIVEPEDSDSVSEVATVLTTPETQVATANESPATPKPPVATTNDDSAETTEAVTNVPSQELAYVDTSKQQDTREEEEVVDDSSFSREDALVVDQGTTVHEEEDEEWMTTKFLKSNFRTLFYSMLPDGIETVDDSSVKTTQSGFAANDKEDDVSEQNIDLIGANWLSGNSSEDSFLFIENISEDIFAGWYQVINNKLSALMIFKIEPEHVLKLQSDESISRSDLMDAGIYRQYSNWTNKYILCEDSDEERLKGSLVIFKSHSGTPLTYGDYMLDVDEFKKGYAKLEDRKSGEELSLETIDSDKLRSLDNSASMFSYYFKNQVTSLAKDDTPACE